MSTIANKTPGILDSAIYAHAGILKRITCGAISFAFFVFLDARFEHAGMTIRITLVIPAPALAEQSNPRAFREMDWL